MDPVLIDLTHTAHTGARTGVQRVTRNLWRVLGPEAVPVVFDRYARSWRRLDNAEMKRLSDPAPARSRGARWTWAQKGRGWLHRAIRSRGPAPPNASGLILPEVFLPAVGSAFRELDPIVRGPRVAIFHDAIPLQRPEYFPAATVARFPAYLHELAGLDGVAASSAETRNMLQTYWEWLGLKSTPALVAITLGVEPPPVGSSSLPARSGPHAGPPVILCVSTVEGRKNHVALLDACEELWTRGMRFQLRLIGLPRPETAAAALARIEALRRIGRPLHYDGPVDDSRLEAAYAEAAFTVYPSLVEGFGLPVAESLTRGKPCVCLGSGALGEIATGGGCLTVPVADARHLADACARLLEHEAERANLAEAAQRRRFKTPAQYGEQLREWMKTLPRRSA